LNRIQTISSAERILLFSSITNSSNESTVTPVIRMRRRSKRIYNSGRRARINDVLSEDDTNINNVVFKL